MENNYIIDLKGCYLPTVNDWQMLLDCIKGVKANQIISDKLELLYPSTQFVYYRGNQLVIFTNTFFAHVYKDEVSEYTICKITDSKQAVHIDIEKSVAFMLTDAINRTKDIFSFDPKITRQSHPYLPPNSNE